MKTEGIGCRHPHFCRPISRRELPQLFYSFVGNNVVVPPEKMGGSQPDFFVLGVESGDHDPCVVLVGEFIQRELVYSPCSSGFIEQKTWYIILQKICRHWSIAFSDCFERFGADGGGGIGFYQFYQDFCGGCI